MRYSFATILDKISYYPRTLLIVSLALWSCFCSYVYVNSFQNTRKDLHERYSEQQIVLLTSAYSGLIAADWQDKNRVEAILKQFRSNWQRIKNVTLVNQYAGVLSPRDKTFEVVADIPLEKIMEGTSTQEIAIDGESGILYLALLSEQKQIIGALIVEFATVIKDSGNGSFGTFYLFIFMLFSVAMAYGLFWLLMRPWNQLGQQVDANIEKPQSFQTKTTVGKLYNPLDQHHHLYRRLFAKLKHMK